MFNPENLLALSTSGGRRNPITVVVISSDLRPVYFREEVALNSDDFEKMKVDLCNIFDHKLVVGEDINSHFSRLGIPSNICEVLDSRSLPIPMGYQPTPLRYRNPMENAIRAMQLFTNYAQMRQGGLMHAK
ncbi:Oidioi.mRNA.OKI2018_I69.chr1.g2614.t1.cds [Oikopleura dioica]|uniref:Oidioi.mRNA.OKI2018_I69.chr1.g2614.t1.cds n=1 Tax=Oikopleura dioica TaxID=34765 RepID=A0ABN7SVI7_OIKDI|nr:Oidioi.mRNA.OKI2018_I69.chr1.g2614.t1.cds [Oikopleura dioica]